jgi:hypothetical protein
MGQQVGVVEKPSRKPAVVRFEANRNLTGQGHERFSSPADAIGERPAAELARRLFATGRVANVHLYGNVITVDLHKGFDSTGLGDIICDLYQYWRPGMTPPTFDDVVAEEAAAAPAVGGGGGGEVDAALAEAAKRVPAHLLERSRQARERWRAAHG